MIAKTCLAYCLASLGSFCTQGADTLKCDEHSSHQDHQVKDEQEPITFLVELIELNHQSSQSHNQQEGQRSHYIGGIYPSAYQHDCNDQQGQTCEQLVGRTKQRPNQQSARTTGTTGTESQQQTRSNGENSCREWSLEPFDTIDLTPLLENITLQTQACIHGGACKQGGHNSQQCRCDLGIYSYSCLQDDCTTVDKGIDPALTKGMIHGLPISEGCKTS